MRGSPPPFLQLGVLRPDIEYLVSGRVSSAPQILPAGPGTSVALLPGQFCSPTWSSLRPVGWQTAEDQCEVIVTTSSRMTLIGTARLANPIHFSAKSEQLAIVEMLGMSLTAFHRPPILLSKPQRSLTLAGLSGRRSRRFLAERCCAFQKSGGKRHQEERSLSTSARLSILSCSHDDSRTKILTLFRGQSVPCFALVAGVGLTNPPCWTPLALDPVDWLSKHKRLRPFVMTMRGLRSSRGFRRWPREQLRPGTYVIKTTVDHQWTLKHGLAVV